MGLGTAWGGRLPCKEDIRWVRFPQGPPIEGNVGINPPYISK